jgi:small subunit ribosomal protein S20
MRDANLALGAAAIVTGSLPRFGKPPVRISNAMANIKSQKKRNLTNEKRRLRNKGVKSELKTRIKTARSEISSGGESAEAVTVAQRRLDKAATKRVIHKNQASRRTSRLMKAANKTAS